MNKEILRKNIEYVISQPSNSKYPTEIKPNGLSENGEYIMLKPIPEDCSWQCSLEGDFIERILEKLPAKYRDHLVTIAHDEWISYSYVPVFDTDTQAMWDKELEDYMADKAAWCAKYGCD